MWLFCRFSNGALQSFLLRPLSILCHSTFSWVGATPSLINSLGSIQAHHLIWGSTSFCLALQMQHSFAHSLMADRSMVVEHVPMDHTCSSMCTGHIDMTAQPFYELGSTLGISCMLVWHKHSRTWQVSIISIAATSMSLIVTHPSANWAQRCLLQWSDCRWSQLANEGTWWWMKKKEKKERMNLHIKKRKYFLKDFIYNINHYFVVLPNGWLVASQQQNVKQKSVYLTLKSR